jgi:hypothetical protein
MTKPSRTPGFFELRPLLANIICGIIVACLLLIPLMVTLSRSHYPDLLTLTVDILALLFACAIGVNYWCLRRREVSKSRPAVFVLVILLYSVFFVLTSLCTFSVVTFFFYPY